MKVTATLVDHHQVFPSIAYRFDTKGNLQKLANGADILIHEVIDRAWIDQKCGTPAPGSQMDTLKTHMLPSHTANDVVGKVAASSNVTALVLNHIVPGNTPDAHLLVAEDDFPGEIIISEDFMEIGLTRETD